MEIIKINGLHAQHATTFFHNISWSVEIISPPPLTTKYWSINNEEPQFGVAFSSGEWLKKLQPDKARMLLVSRET